MRYGEKSKIKLLNISLNADFHKFKNNYIRPTSTFTMMRHFRFFLFIACLFGCFTTLNGQSFSASGRFPSRHFSINDYGSASQIWCGTQSSSGLFLFGTRQDILCFNGNEWQKVKVDKTKTSAADQKITSKSYVSFIYESSQKKVFVGRENNFGYLDYNLKGEYTYFPLKVVPEEKGFGKIWNIFEINNGEVLFVAEKKLFTVKNKTVSSFPLPASLNNMICQTSVKLNRGLLLVYRNKESETSQQRDYKYYYIDILTGKGTIYNGFSTENGKDNDFSNLRGSFEIDGKWYVQDIREGFYEISESNGQFKWSHAPKTFFASVKDYNPNSIFRVGNYIYYSSENNGLILLDLKGNIVRQFDFYDKLENLNVYYTFKDADGNIWMCLENGIQFLETSIELSFLNKDEGIASPIITFDLKNNHNLVGLYSDVYHVQSESTHQLAKTTDIFKQMIFDIISFETSQGEKTLVIGYDGVYEYNTKTATKKIATQVYAYAFLQDPNNKDRVFITKDVGLGYLELQKDGSWKFVDLVEDAKGETISLAYHKGKIYFSIRNKGVGVYNLATKQFKVIPIEIKGEEDMQFYVQTFKNNLYVGTANGIFMLDEVSQKFKPYAAANKLISRNEKTTIHRLINIEDKQLWVVSYKELSDNDSEFETGWLEYNNNNLEYIKWPLAGLKNAGIVSAIAKHPDGTIWLGANQGLFIFNPESVRKRASNLKVNISRFEINNKVMLHDVLHASKLDALTYEENSFKFYFYANTYSSQGPTKFRYRLEGYSDNWSEWSELNFANFEKIPEGTYTLKVQAQNFYGQESDVLTYEITILPPWYRTVWAYLLYIVLLIVIVFIVVQLSTQRVKRQNIRLEEIVQQRTSEIAEQNHQLELQKAEIQHKTNDILDSIHYAKRIQTTILPAESRLKELFDEHFVFYRPKDIVSGDFYWAREVQDQLIFSAVDCTGHGVPGALVSIVGNNGLLRAVNEFKLVAPNEILDKLREIVIDAFRADGQFDVKDGMDIALCSVDPKTGILRFAGANNDCVIVRKGEIIELKPDKQPIGQFIDAKPFTMKEFQLEPGDCIYMSTDGYVDQFGGERMKKFKSKPFKALLAEIATLPMNEQYNRIQQTFDDWKGELEQVDDVCVFAVKYNGIKA